MEIPEIPDFSREIAKITKRHNERVLGGEGEMRMFPSENEIEYLEKIASDPKFRKDLKEFIEKFVVLKSENQGQILDGFIFDGSWVNGVPKYDSDFDILLFINDRVIDEKVITFGSGFTERKMHIETSASKSQYYIELIDSKLKGEKTSVYFHEYIAGILTGIPFGPYAIKLQYEIIKHIDSIPNTQAKENLWKSIAYEIGKRESGQRHKFFEKPDRSNQHEENGKYFILNKPLTFEQFVSRWEKRVEWSRKFCSENGIEF